MHAFLTQAKSGKLPCPAPEAPRPARPVDLFGSLPDSITPVLGVEMLRHRLVGHHLTCWEADLIFPLWLAVWREWHSQWEKLKLSDLAVSDLGARRRQIATAWTICESPTMVGDAPVDSVAWHVDFFGRPEAVSGCGFDGNCILVCSTSFDWADVFMLAVAFLVQAVCGVDGPCVCRSSVDIAGSLLLVAGLSEKLVVPVLVAGLQDPLAKVVLVTAPGCWSFLWATVDAEVASTEWLTIAEWASSGDSGVVLLLLARAPAPPVPPLAVLVDSASWIIRAGLSIPPRVLSIDVPYNILCPLEGDAPPQGVSQWVDCPPPVRPSSHPPRVRAVKRWMGGDVVWPLQNPDARATPFGRPPRRSNKGGGVQNWPKAAQNRPKPAKNGQKRPKTAPKGTQGTAVRVHDAS